MKVWYWYRSGDELKNELKEWEFVYAGEGRFYCFERQTLKGIFEREILSRCLSGREVIVRSLEPPPGYLKGFFAVVKVKSGDYLSCDERALVEKGILDRERLLSEKYGVKIVKPPLTLQDLKGAKVLKEFILEIKDSLEYEELRPKGVFLIGVPGTGKSYSCFCSAGEMDRIVVELNLSRILESDRPITALEKFFELVEILPPSVVWIDEVDKVFRESDAQAEKIKGRLLTELEDFNTDRGYRADALFWVTANDVRPIVKQNPEFFRRFDYLFFLQTPKKSEAEEIAEYYLSRFGLEADRNLLSLYGKRAAALVRVASKFWEHEFSKVSSNVGDTESFGDPRFVYTPAEIKGLVLKLARRLMKRKTKEFTEEDLTAVMKKHYPAVIAYEDAISGMREQLKYFAEV